MKKEIAKDLLKIKAVFLRPNEPFTWASGIKSPIYCDNRLTLSYVDVRDKIENGIKDLILEHFSEAEAIFGTATAGIPHAAIVAHKLNKPMGYVRGSKKDHGRQNNIEGKYEKGEKVVVIEDLISTGKSSIEAVNALRKEGVEVLGVISIFTYNMEKAKENFKENNIKCISLTDFDTIIEVANENGYIKNEDVEKLKKFIKNPSDESWIK